MTLLETPMNTAALTTLGRKIRTARVAADLKQDELAKAVGVSRSAVGQWEHDETEPSALKMFAIAEATKQPLSWFAEGLSGVARPKGLEPLTFWSVVAPDFWDHERVESWAGLARQLTVDSVSPFGIEA